jgi:hypothetical protein
MKTEEIIEGFAKAGLIAVPMKRPMFMGPDARSAFFLTVRGKKYEFWAGREENTVQILNADSDLRQLVLLVKEPGGTIIVKEYDAQKRKLVDKPHRIPKQTRRFLVGFDERDLFMAQLPAAARITTVRQAHEVLRPGNLPGTASIPKKVKVVRQGEWFFYPATEDEKMDIRKLHMVVKKKARIGGPGMGKPHTADEYLEILAPVQPALAGTAGRRWGPVRGEISKMYVRGRVRHLDHETVAFLDWQRVVMNTEDRGRRANWID